MGRVIVTDTLLDDLADAISTVTGESTPMSIEDMTDAVEAVTPRTSGDITVSGRTVSVPSGYYASSTSKSVASGSATTPTTTITANPSISVDSATGVITATVSGSESVTPTVSAGYVSSGTAGTVSVSGSNTSSLSTESGKTVTPTTSQQTAVASGKYTTGAIIVDAMPSGTAGTPTATKGTVNNHSISVTPSVTNTSGYITGSTKTGTAVTVSASELVSGSETKTSNGTYNVTNLAELVVNVSGGGGGKNVQYVMGSASVRTNGYTSTGMSITVAKTGTYKVSWAGWRSSSQGTMGTNLYKNGSAGTNQQTFTNNYGQCITLNNQSYNSGDVLTLYATAGSTSRYMWVANLIIEEQ